nr:hypothetical protein [Pseudonocardia nigra]
MLVFEPDPLVIVAPSTIVGTLATLLTSPAFWPHLIVSMEGFVLGYALSALIAVPLGLVIGSSRALYRYTDPWISALYAAPIIGLAPLFIIIFGFGLQAKVAVVVALAVFPMLINTVAGARGLLRPPRARHRLPGQPQGDVLADLPARLDAVHPHRPAAGRRPRTDRRRGRRPVRHERRPRTAPAAVRPVLRHPTDLRHHPPCSPRWASASPGCSSTSSAAPTTGGNHERERRRHDPDHRPRRPSRAEHRLRRQGLPDRRGPVTPGPRRRVAADRAR